MQLMPFHVRFLPQASSRSYTKESRKGVMPVACWCRPGIVGSARSDTLADDVGDAGRAGMLLGLDDGHVLFGITIGGVEYARRLHQQVDEVPVPGAELDVILEVAPAQRLV